METHSHISQHPNTQQHHQQMYNPITSHQNKMEGPRTTNYHILEHLTSWLTDKPTPPTGWLATNPEHIRAVESQTSIGWGCFFKGFCATKLQNVVNTQCEAPLNGFEQLQWTIDVIQCVWDSEAEHWKLRNGNKHGHTPAETDSNKREHLLAITRDLIQTQHQLPPRYKKMYTKSIKKHTQNLESITSST
jgi:hypothetical protein